MSNYTNEDIYESYATEEENVRTDEKIDIEAIMDEIRAGIAAHPKEDVLAFSEVPIPAVEASLQSEETAPEEIYQQISNEAAYLKNSSGLSYYSDLGSGPKSFVKRVIRKLIKGIILPIIERLNDYQIHVANSIDATRIISIQQNSRLQALESRMNEVNDILQSRLMALESRTDAVQTNEDDLRNTFITHKIVLDRKIRDGMDKLARCEQSILEQKNRIAEHQARIDSQQNGIIELQDKHNEQHRRIDDQQKRIAEQQMRIGSQQKGIVELQDKYNSVNNKLNEIDHGVDEITLSVAQVISRYLTEGTIRQSENSEKLRIKEKPAQQSDTEEYADEYTTIDYFRFQNDFRGTQNQIMERQKIYLPYFRGKKGRVFDLGCGRGEFLRLLKEEHIQAFGVDTYSEYAVTAQLYGIDVRIGDGITMLESMEEPLGGIFCAQVIEHLGFRTVEKLSKIAYEKLEDGGCLIMETPNPRSVSTMTNAFYLDPTHDKPVHPLLMEYLLKQIGFSEVQLIWPDHSLPQIPKIQSDCIDNLTEINNAIERVSGLLFGSQDYAVVAKK